MKLSQELNDALCQQILHEMRNVVIYMQIASYFDDLRLNKLSKYFIKQSQHEKEHADMFMKYINSRTGGNVMLGEIEEPMLSLSDINSVVDAYVMVEESTTKSIEDLYSLALGERSYMDLGFIQGMLNEQVEEEDSAMSFSLRAKMAKDLVLFDATFGE